jgi:hypothetical protein
MNQDPTPVPVPDGVRAGQPPLDGPPRSPSPYSQPAPASSPSTAEVKDGHREIVETIVFVVVLVLLLKTFLAEAFVIPTGSMATTLLGYHKEVTCEQCKYPFRVNASEEVESKPADLVIEWTCPNCRFHNRPFLKE